MLSSWLWLPLALLSAVFAALVAIFGKIGLSKVDSTVATMVRAAFMFLLLLGVVLLGGKWHAVSSVQGKALLFVALSGLAGALSWIFYFWALQAGKVSQIVPIDRSSVVIALVLAALFLHEQLNWKSGLGGLLIAAGAILVALA